MCDNYTDLIDSREVLARIDELQTERAELITQREDASAQLLQLYSEDAIDETGERASLKETLEQLTQDIEVWDRNFTTDLKALLDLADQGETSPNWQSGETLIRGTYFKEYAQQFAEDIGAVNLDMGWPHSYIDWDQAADELKLNYTCVDFDGVDYWIRS